MYTKSKDTGIYIGRDAGRDLHNSVLNANKSVKIVSPYLTPDYIKNLIHLKNKGVDVTLITSDNLEEKIEEGPEGLYSSHLNYIKQARTVDGNAIRRRNINIRFLFIPLVISIALIFFGFFKTILLPIGFVITLILVLVIYICLQTIIYSYHYYPIFKLKIFFSEGWKGFLIHAKIFVIDDKVAFLGSTNFTYSGFVRNYESSIKVVDSETVGIISREVDNLFNNTELAFMDIQQWGKQLYLEPPHESLYWQIIGNSLLSK